MADEALLRYLEGFISEARRQRFLTVLQHRTRFLTLAMEDVFQLHNASAVIRTCEVFGLQDLHLVEARFAKRLDRKISLGAQQWVDVHKYSNSAQCISALREKGYAIVAATPVASGVSLETFRPERPSALFFGTEKEGLSSTVLQQADTQLRIPMTGFTESLNISVSVGIVLYQLTTSLRQSGLEWRLSEAEILEKRLDWTKKSIRSVREILKRFEAENQDR